MVKIDSSSLRNIHLRMHQVRALKPLFLTKDILNTEALMLVLNKKYKSSDGRRMLFKYLDMQEDLDIMNNKTLVLSYLNHSSYKELDDLIIPDAAVYVDSNLTGFAMPLIENHYNLGRIINNSNIPFGEKKEYLMQLGNLIDHVHRLDDNHEMFFGDLNEYNFIIDNKGVLKAIDLDSSYVAGIGVRPFQMAYYLLKNQYITSLPDKYSTTEEGIIIPSRNSDLYCYNMIILDALADEAIFKQDINTFYEYLFYIEELGVSEEIIGVLERIYLPNENLNPKDILEGIPDNISEKAKFKVFQKS